MIRSAEYEIVCSPVPGPIAPVPLVTFPAVGLRSVLLGMFGLLGLAGLPAKLEVPLLGGMLAFALGLVLVSGMVEDGWLGGWWVGPLPGLEGSLDDGISVFDWGSDMTLFDKWPIGCAGFYVLALVGMGDVCGGS